MHKVQGLTLNCVVLYLRDCQHFGLVYVGMSRVCSIGWLSFGSLVWKHVNSCLIKEPMAKVREFYHMLAQQNMTEFVRRLLDADAVALGNCLVENIIVDQHEDFLSVRNVFIISSFDDNRCA